MGTALISVFSFVILLGILVFVHELGHFIMAKRAGIRVDKFSLGFPPNIFQRTWGETEYCIGLIPLGGYVKMAGEAPDEEPTGRGDEFAGKSLWARIQVIAAGPVMNYVFAILLFSGLVFAIGTPIIDQPHAVVGKVMPDRPAEKAGLMPGDTIVSVNGVAVTTFDSLSAIVSKQREHPVELVWLRDGDSMRATVATETREFPREDGKVDTIAQIGIQRLVTYDRSHGIFESIGMGFQRTNEMVGGIFSFVGKFVTRQTPANSVGGPLFIAQQSAEAAREGLASFVFLMALLSVNLAVLNILPIPVLDGGHLLFLAIEGLKGSPLSSKVRVVAQQAGMVFLLVFIVFVSWNDLMRWFK